MPGAKVCIEFVSADVGGRNAPPIASSAYRPHFRVGVGGHLGVALSSGDFESVDPGRSVNVEVAFVYASKVNYDALVVGAQFQVLEGDRIVGIGRVLEVLP